MSKPYDPGDESGSVPTLADAATTDTPVGGIVYLNGATPTFVALAAGLPIQPGTGTTWTVSDGGGSLTVDGTVAVSGSVAVTGTFWQATQPVSIAATVAVSGPLTDAQLRASAVPVSLTSTTITGTVGTLETRPAAAAVTSVAGSATSVNLLAANTARRGAVVVNDSTAVLYVKLGETASATSYTYRLPAYATLELPDPVYTGRIDGIWASATGNARVTEVS